MCVTFRHLFYEKVKRPKKQRGRGERVKKVGHLSVHTSKMHNSRIIGTNVPINLWSYRLMLPHPIFVPVLFSFPKREPLCCPREQTMTICNAKRRYGGSPPPSSNNNSDLPLHPLTTTTWTHLLVLNPLLAFRVHVYWMKIETRWRKRTNFIVTFIFLF